MTPRRRDGRARLALRILWRRLRLVGPIFVGVYTATATALYLLEHNAPGATLRRFSDAVWFCLVTMSTVGYGDVYPTTSAGRVIAGVFILFTLGTLGVLLTAVNEAVLEVKRMEEAGLIPTKMRRHVVVCGFNAMARAALVELLAAERPVALLCERPEDLETARTLRAGKVELFITSGEPTQDVLRERLNAGEADAIIVAMNDDARNLIATLNVKAVNPDARLVVALQREELRQTLEAGGVTYVASPNELSGRLVASAAFEPEVAQMMEDFMSGAHGEFDMQQYQAGPLGGGTVSDVRKKLAAIDGPLLVAIAKPTDGKHFKIIPHPRRDLPVATADHLIVVARDEEAERLVHTYKIVQGR
jgi:voltage-gated potassium channel